MERTAADRIQQMIDDEVAKHFPEGPVRRLVLLRHGDHPVIEPGEQYLQVLIGKEDAKLAARDAWLDEEHMDWVEKFRAERLPEVSGFVVTVGDPGATDGPTVRIMQIDPAEPEVPSGLTPVMARLGRADLETLDVLITAGIAANRAEACRWALARIRERPAYARLSEWARELDELKSQF